MANLLSTNVSGRLYVSGYTDTNSVNAAFRFYDSSTFRGGLGLDDWAHGGSAANITMYVQGDNNFFISTSGVKRAQFNSTAAIFRTYTADNGYNIRITSGDQFNAYYNDSATTMYINWNGGTTRFGGEGRFNSSLYSSGYVWAENANVRVGEIWGHGGLYRSSGDMMFGTEGGHWYFQSQNNTRAQISQSDGNIWMSWANDWISNLLASKVSTSGGQTIAGTTYFSGVESLNLYGIRGRFTNEYIHLYHKVGIGHPSGWGQGEGNTPGYGLSTYGGMNIAYGNGASSTINGYLRINQNWAGGDYGAEALTIRGTYPSIALRSTGNDSKWLIHHSNSLQFYYGGTVDDNSWGQKIQFASDGNIWSSYYNDWLSNIFNSKQNASTAITTSNIGSQSVNYASSAGNADTVDGQHASYFYPAVTPDGYSTGDINGSTTQQRLWGTDSVQDLLSFNPPTRVEYTTDDVNWIETNIGNNVFSGKIYGAWSGFSILAGDNIGRWTKVRMTWENFGYRFFSHFTLAHSTNGHSFNFVFQKSDLNGENWTEQFRQNGIGSWPGYTFAKHTNVSGWWDTRDIRMVFEVNNGGASYADNAINFGHIGIMGSYGSFNRLFDWNGDKNVYFSNQVHANDFRASIFYDSDNTAYYLDPSSNTSLRTVGSWRADSSGWDGEYSGKIQYHSNHWYFQSGDQWIFRNAGGSNVVNINQSGQITSSNIYAPIFYDSNDNAFYLDPNGSSRLAETVTDQNYTYGWYRNYGAKGMYNQDYGTHFYSYGSENWGITGNGGNVLLAFRTNHESTILGYVHANTGNNIGFLSEDGNWVLRTWNRGVEAYGSMRAPIFYDSDDTTYYVDPNSESSLSITRTALRARQGMTGYGNGTWVEDFNATPVSSMTFGQDKYNGGPTGTWWFQVNMRHNNGSDLWGTQLAYGWEDNANEIYQRNVTGGNWSGWVRYINTNNYAGILDSRYQQSSTAITTSNIGSQSVSNADTVDSLHASDFVRAYTTTNDNIDADWGQSFKTFDPIPSGTPPIQSPNLRTINVGNDFNRRTQIAFTYNEDRTWFRKKYNDTWGTWNEYIHSGNIGSQSVSYASTSGDANTLDGLDSSRFLYTTTGQFSGDWNTLTDGDQEIRLVQVNNISGGAHSNYPTGLYPYGSVLGWQLDEATFKMYASHTGDLAFQTGWNNDGYSGWRTIIHSANIGSQSVNYASSAGNADTVDGYHESDFWRNNQNRVIGVLRFTGEGGDSGNGNIATSYGIYQQGGAWTHPYPDLCIGFHTGIKIGAHYNYGGTRFYNNSDWATEIFSIGNGDNNVRAAGNIYAGGSLNGTGFYGNSVNVGTAGSTPTTDYGIFHHSGVGLGIVSAAGGSTQGISFWSHSGSSYFESVRIAGSTGNVGIGTTSPGDYKLYVNGGQFGTLLRGGDLGTGSDVVRMIKSDNSIAMLVRGDGNVGIGTTSPSYHLEVAGNAYVSNIFSTPNYIKAKSTYRYNSTAGLPGQANPVKTASGVLATYSGDGASFPYIIIKTRIPQDWYQMGGFTIDLFGRYNDTNAKTTITLGGYWNPESNSGFLGFEYTTTNPNVRPDITVMRDITDGMTCFVIHGMTWSYPQVVARDLFLGYNSNDIEGGLDWSIFGADDLGGYTNNDAVICRTAIPADQWYGNTYIAYDGRHYGTIFYDSNDTSYYCDPNNTSRLHIIKLSTDQWNQSSDGYNRLYFGNNARTYFGSGNGYEFRSAADANIASISNAGDFVAAGDVTAYSDARIKTNVQTIENALDKTLKLRGVTYNRTDSEDTSTKVGVIAQEILEVIPEVVKQNDEGMYSVSYGNLTAVLIEAIKEQQKQIDELKEIINGITK